MSDRLLISIIELEKTLQEEVRREEDRAAAWRERERLALAQMLAAEQRQRQSDMAARAVEARREAGAAAERLRLETDEWCARLAALPDSLLEAVLRTQLPAILPETDDDHPHGQG